MQVWDDKLTRMAEEYAKLCVFAHGQATCSDNTEYVGQNLAYETGKGKKDRPHVSMINHWYDEKDNYNINTDTCASNKMCSHYTQVGFIHQGDK